MLNQILIKMIEQFGMYPGYHLDLEDPITEAMKNIKSNCFIYLEILHFLRVHISE